MAEPRNPAPPIREAERPRRPRTVGGVFTRPEGLDDDDVVGAVAAGWGVRAAICHLPVGFGSHHWRLDEDDGRAWFVTVDDLAARRRSTDEPAGESLHRLSAALSTARALRDAGKDFVVAPRRTASGDVLHPLGDRYAVALYPHVDGEPGEWGPYPSTEARRAVVDLVAEVHTAPAAVRAHALVEDFAIAHRDDLRRALDDLAHPWDGGPFAEPARELLARHARDVHQALDRHDRLAANAARRPERRVLTHGEPHPGNTIRTDTGVVLVDWDTALLAPPERDLWSLAEEDAGVVAHYVHRTGVEPVADTIELYRLTWDLTEVAIGAGELRRPHRRTADTAVTWAGFGRYLGNLVLDR